MKRRAALLPFAVLAAGIVLASSLALLGVVRGPSAAQPEASSSPAPQLSASGRLAYWKPVSNTHSELWVSDLDGRRAWPLLREPTSLAVLSTRWSPNGETVGYIRGNTSVVVAGIDGTGWVLRVPFALLKEDLRIVGYSVSPDARWVAITLEELASNSPVRLTDVYVVELYAAQRLAIPMDGAPEPRVGPPPWTRVTELGDAFAGQWISGDELFIETANGMIGRLDVETKGLWPITALNATSPVFGADGRLYFAGGGSVHPGARGGPWATGEIWSAKLDGTDSRREVELTLQSARLQTRLADGRFVIGAPGSTYLLGKTLMPTPWHAGTIHRVVASRDGSQVIGITGERVVRMALAKIPDAGAPAETDSVTTLLDGVRDADAWFPQAVGAPLPPPPAPGGPTARLAFQLGSSLWEISGDGSIRPIISAPPGGWIESFEWSPAGDRIAVVVSEPGSAIATSLVMLGPSGEIWRAKGHIGPTFSWSKDGAELVVSYAAPEGEPHTTVRLDATTGTTLARHGDLNGRWTSRGLIGTNAGVPQPQGPWTAWADNAIYLVDQADRRTKIVDARALATELGQRLSGGGPAQIYSVEPSPSGDHIAASIHRPGSRNAAYVVMTLSGDLLWVLEYDAHHGPHGAEWSPDGSLLAVTAWGLVHDPEHQADPRAAAIVDVRGGGVIRQEAGRFAGWHPSGEQYYVARADGLYAQRVTGGELERVGPFSAQVNATAR